MEYFIFFFLLLRLWRLKSPRFNPKDTGKCQNTHTGNSQTAELLHFVTKSMRLLNLSCCLFSFLSFYFSVAPIWLQSSQAQCKIHAIQLNAWPHSTWVLPKTTVIFSFLLSLLENTMDKDQWSPGKQTCISLFSRFWIFSVFF